MKRLLYILAALIIYMGLCVDASESPNPSRSLVVYYSWGGNTRIVAERLARMLQADIYEIRTINTYPRDGRETAMISIEERRTGNLPEIHADLPDLTQYERVYLGGPVWNAYIPTPLARYLELTDLTGKHVCPFWTDHGTGIKGYQNDFSSRARNPLMIHEGLGATYVKNMDGKEIDDKLRDWISRIHPTDQFNSSVTISDIMSHPAFTGYGEFLFPGGRGLGNNMQLKEIDALLPFHRHIDPGTTLQAVNHLLNEAKTGRKIFFDYYTEEQKRNDPGKRQTGLLFFKGSPGAPFAIISPGGGFSYVGSVHEGFPYAIELNKRGYNAFVLHYRLGGGVGSGERIASEDLAAALSFILRNADTFEVNPESYSLWGSSAGAMMSANIGSKGCPAFGINEPSKPCAVIMAYTRYTHLYPDLPPTFFIVSSDDRIVMGGVDPIDKRISELRSKGAKIEYRRYTGIGHGFGLGVGTDAEGWVQNAIGFWEDCIAETKRRN